MFSLLDKKAETWSQPSFDVTKGSMTRAFSDVVNDEQSMLNKHPYDYDLYYLGEFDTTTGKFALLERPEFMYGAFEFLENMKASENAISNEKPVQPDTNDKQT